MGANSISRFAGRAWFGRVQEGAGLINQLLRILANYLPLTVNRSYAQTSFASFMSYQPLRPLSFIKKNAANMASMCRICSKDYVLNCRRCRLKTNIHRLAGPDKKKSETVAQVYHP